LHAERVVLVADDGADDFGSVLETNLIGVRSHTENGARYHAGSKHRKKANSPSHVEKYFRLHQARQGSDSMAMPLLTRAVIDPPEMGEPAGQEVR
jgi:hypothetical protein